jgi:general secretion pathway protein G
MKLNKTVRIHFCNSIGGFTLVEILLVVTIIGILIAMVVPRLTGRSKQAKISVAKAEVEAGLSVALDLYELDNGVYPTTAQGLRALIKEPDISPLPSNWNGPYLKKAKIPHDPWDNEYVYICPGIQNPMTYDLKSFGPDGVEDSGDDITNWGNEDE